MIIQLVTDHPEAILQILRHTPVWVWGLLVTLLAVGARQMRSRQEGLRRVFIMPLGMMYTITHLASLTGMPVEWAIAAATGNNATVYRRNSGFLRAGKDADVVIIDSCVGGSKHDPLDSLRNGDIAAVGAAQARCAPASRLPSSAFTSASSTFTSASTISTGLFPGLRIESAYCRWPSLRLCLRGSEGSH